jgi:hypothetical protein
MTKRFLSVLGSLLVLASLASAQTPADKDKAVKYLESTRQGVIDATAGLSEAQLNFKPAPDRWSVAEVTEHIAAAEDLLMGLITTQVMKAGPRPAGDDVQAIDIMVMEMVPDRSHKAQAPDSLKPTNRFGSQAASLKHFTDARSQTIDFVRQHSDLRDHAIPNQAMGKNLDAYEWTLFIAAHSERHTKQIDEVKADPNFPKK